MVLWVLRTIRKAEYAELVALFFLQGAALGMWFVPLSTVLDAHGLHAIKPFAFAATALAAFVSPLIFGAMADRQASPVIVLRGLSLATAAAMALASTAIKLGWSPWLVLALIQLHALCSSPTFSIASTIVFARLADAQKEFGPIRAMATLGWMAGCWVVSALGADTSPLAGYSGAVMWVLVAAFTFFLPELETPKSAEHLTWHERLGLDALTLLKNPDHRVVFITSALFCIPLAGFYPYAPPHLRQLGLQHTSAWMTLGQVTEVIAMFSLGALLLKWRLKWIFACGLGFRRAAVRVERGQRQGVGPRRGSAARLFLHAGLYHGADLPRPARGRRVAGAGAGVAVTDEQRRRQPPRLPGHRLVVQRLHAIRPEHNGRSSGADWPRRSALVMAYFLTAYHGVGLGLPAGKGEPPSRPLLLTETARRLLRLRKSAKTIKRSAGAVLV